MTDDENTKKRLRDSKIQVATFHLAERVWSGKERVCPKCERGFSSITNRGQCQSCGYIFYASHPEAGDTRWAHSHESITETCRSALTDVNDKVRRAAVWALRAIGSESASSLAVATPFFSRAARPRVSWSDSVYSNPVRGSAPPTSGKGVNDKLSRDTIHQALSLPETPRTAAFHPVGT